MADNNNKNKEAEEEEDDADGADIEYPPQPSQQQHQQQQKQHAGMESGSGFDDSIRAPLLARRGSSSHTNRSSVSGADDEAGIAGGGIEGIGGDGGGGGVAGGGRRVRPSKPVSKSALFVIFGLIGAFVAVNLSVLIVALVRTDADDKIVVYYNGIVHTVDDALPSASSFAVQNGKFIAVGSDDEMIARYPDKERYDLKGHTVIPGMIDAHAHLMGQAYLMIQADLYGCRSIEEVIETLNEFVEENPPEPGEWLLGRGWDHTLWGTEFPTKEDLDDAFPDTPVWLERVDGHAKWSNSATLDEVGEIPEEDPQGGEIVRDDETGEPTGIFIDNAMLIVDEHVPPYSNETKATALSLALHEINKYGLTGIHDAGVIGSDIEFFKSFVDEGKFTIRNYIFVTCDTGVYFCPEVHDKVLNYKDRLTIRSVKLVLDGALGSWGAALLAPYSDDNSTCGILVMEDAETELVPVVKQWTDIGFQVNTHAIGDRANRIVIDAYEEVINGLGEEGKNLRLRIEHAQVLVKNDTQDDVSRLAPLGIIPSIQPTHATSDMGFAESRLGSERMTGAYVIKGFFESGISYVPFGSDFPVELVNPFRGLHSAVNRQNDTFYPPDGWHPEQKITVEEALRMYTLGSAYAAFQEDILGSISPEKYADFVILDQDILTVPSSDILETKVLATFLGGDCVYLQEGSVFDFECTN